MPGASAATQSNRWGKSPNKPSRVSATMRETPVLSAKIWNGSSTLRFMSAGCCMCDLRVRLWIWLGFGLGFGFGIGGGFRVALGAGLGLRFGFRRRLGGAVFSLRFVNRPDHVERALRVVFEFIA